MATWPQVKSYLAGNYTISQDLGHGVKLEFGVGLGRSQLVFITHHGLMDGTEDWAIVESPFGEFGKVNLDRAVVAVGEMVCGGIGLFGGKYLTLRDAVPLTNLDVNELERPIQLLTTSADRLEAALTGRDQF